MKAKELKEKNSEELKKIIQEKRSMLCQLRFGIKARQVKNHQQMKEVKKDIAKILTFIKQEESEELIKKNESINKQ